MIKGVSLHTPSSGVEEMFVSGSIDGSFVTDIRVHLVYADLNASERIIYDDALSLLGDNYLNNIINTVARLDINRVTSTSLVEGLDTSDFEAFSEPEKDKLSALLNLFIEKTLI